MRRLFDMTCPRCGWTESSEGLDLALVMTLGALHVCVDGVRTPISGPPTLRVVLGPGERTKLPEERGGS